MKTFTFILDKRYVYTFFYIKLCLYCSQYKYLITLIKLPSCTWKKSKTNWTYDSIYVRLKHESDSDKKHANLSHLSLWYIGISTSYLSQKFSAMSYKGLCIRWFMTTYALLLSSFLGHVLTYSWKRHLMCVLLRTMIGSIGSNIANLHAMMTDW